MPSSTWFRDCLFTCKVNMTVRMLYWKDASSPLQGHPLIWQCPSRCPTSTLLMQPRGQHECRQSSCALTVTSGMYQQCVRLTQQGPQELCFLLMFCQSVTGQLPRVCVNICMLFAVLLSEWLPVCPCPCCCCCGKAGVKYCHKHPHR